MKTFEISQTSFLFSGRVGRVGPGRSSRIGWCGTVRVGPVSAKRCGTRRVGANRSVRVGLRRRRQACLRVRHGRAPGALPTLSRAPCLDVDCATTGVRTRLCRYRGALSGCRCVPRRRSGPTADVILRALPGCSWVLRRSSGRVAAVVLCVQSGCSWGLWRASGRAVAVVVCASLRIASPPISPCRLLHALPLLLLLLLLRLRHLVCPPVSSTLLTLCAPRQPRCGAGR